MLILSVSPGCIVHPPADLKDQWRIQKNKQFPYNRIHVMIEEIQGTVFGKFGGHLIRFWGVGDGLERKCSRQREKDVPVWSQENVAYSDKKCLAYT